MPFYRKLIIIISNSSFKLLLFLTIGIVAAILIYSDKTYISSTLKSNDVYSKIVVSLLETNKEQSLTAGSDLTLENEEVQKLISESFPAEDLESNTNQILNAVYSWLEQDVDRLEFTIDLTENKQQLADGLAIYAVNRLQKLPICEEIAPNIDPFSSTCQPPDIDYEKEAKIISEQLYNESGFLEEPVLTEKSVLEDSDGIAFETKYQKIPTYYAIVKQIPVYVVLLLIILALIVIFSSSTKKIGIRKIGRGLVGAGASIIIFTFLFSFVLPTVTGSLPIFQPNDQGIDALINEVSLDFSRDYSLMIIKLSVPLIFVGSIMIIYVNSTKNLKDYKAAKLKSGVISSNEQKAKSKTKTSKNLKPPIQSSENSDTKPKKKIKNKKYRKIPKKEI